MNNDPSILNELNEISPVVAAINWQLPYQVPTGYFDTLANTINTRITYDNAFLNNNKDNVYSTPEGYFDSLAGNIINKIKASEANTPQEELSHLSSVLNTIDKTIPYTRPAGYLEELPENMVAGIKAIDFVNQELENLSPLMSSLKNKQVYNAPEQYFENIADTVLNSIKAKEAKVIAGSFRKRVIKYAVAAAITGIIALSARMSIDSLKSAENPLAGNETIPAEIKAINDSALMSFTDNTLLYLTETTDISIDDLVAKDDENILIDLPDETLQQYLEEGAGENSTLIN
jgi:hypothetical protein